VALFLPFSFLVFLPENLCGLDVGLLALLSAASEQDDEVSPSLPK
jgi:hypothetical protein